MSSEKERLRKTVLQGKAVRRGGSNGLPVAGCGAIKMVGRGG